MWPPFVEFFNEIDSIMPLSNDLFPNMFFGIRTNLKIFNAFIANFTTRTQQSCDFISYNIISKRIPIVDSVVLRWFLNSSKFLWITADGNNIFNAKNDLNNFKNIKINSIVKRAEKAFKYFFQFNTEVLKYNLKNC